MAEPKMVTLPADVLSALMDAADLARQCLGEHEYYPETRDRLHYAIEAMRKAVKI